MITVLIGDKKLEDIIPKSHKVIMLDEADKEVFLLNYKTPTTIVINSNLNKTTTFVTWVNANTRCDVLYQYKSKPKWCKGKKYKAVYGAVEDIWTPTEIAKLVLISKDRDAVYNVLSSNKDKLYISTLFIMHTIDEIGDFNRVVIESANRCALLKNNNTLIHLLTYGIKPIDKDIYMKWRTHKK